MTEPVCKMRRYAPLLLLALVLVPSALPLTPAIAQEPAKMIERTVSVSATGSASAEPDRASISTGVMTDAATARDAMSANTTAMKRLIDGLKSAGIDPKDIRTTHIQVNPRYSQASSKGERQSPAVIGYTAINQVRIIVRDLKRLGEILDQSITLGANQMGGVSFEVSEAETLRDEARKQAMANARRRAELYATAAGAGLGPVATISESIHGPQPRQTFATGRAAMAEAVPVEPGAIDLTAQVHVTYALK